MPFKCHANHRFSDGASSKSTGLLQHSLLPWMVSFLRRFCNECVAWNLLCIAGCGHCSDLDWITRSHTSGLATCIWQNMQTNQHVLNHLFSGVMAKIRFFVEACYKVAFKVRLGTPPAFVVLGVVAWLPMQGRWFIHPRYFSSLQMLDTVIFDIWYAIQMSLMSAWLHSIKAYGHSVTSVVALRAPHGPVVSHWYSCMTHAFPSKIIYWFIWSIWWWFWGNCVFSLSPLKHYFNTLRCTCFRCKV